LRTISDVSYEVNAYILGLLEFDREDAVLNREQLLQIEHKIDQIVENIGGTADPKKAYSPYKVWAVPKYRIEHDMNDDSPAIKHAQLGYYHHRIIFNVSMRIADKSFEDLRVIRDALHNFLRKEIIEYLTSFHINKCNEYGLDFTIKFVYTYPFIVIEGGAGFIAYGRDYADTIFSDATTSFFFKIPESPIIPKNHYVRVSIPCTFLYSSGHPGRGFFCNMINAIYLGGLYEKKRKDREDQTWKNEFDEEILRNLTRLMLEHVAEVQFSVTDMKLSLLAIILAIIALFITSIMQYLWK
jgi:hypothetical protein